MVEPWILHDLRRTVAELGVAPHVLDRVLNHVSGTIKGVARIYRAEYKTERQAALDTWGRYVQEVVDRRRGNGFRFGGRIAGPTPAGIVKSSLTVPPEPILVSFVHPRPCPSNGL